jgi:phosphotransferase system enzyme I (PtsP)
MGGRTLEAMALLGIGIRRLSITPASIGPVKAMVRSLDLAALSAHCEELLKGGVSNLREPLAQWADDNDVELN